MFKSFAVRFFAVYALFSLVLFVIIYYGFNHYMREQFYDKTIQALDYENTMILEDIRPLESLSFDTLEKALSDLTRYSPNNLYVVNRDQIVVFDHDSHISIVGKRLSHPIITVGLKGEKNHLYDTLSHTFSERKVIQTMPIIINSQVVGLLINTTPLPAINDAMNGLFFLVFMVLLIILSAIFSFSYLFSHRASRTLEAFNETAMQIAQGHLSSRVDVPYSDNDIGRLAKNLNHMAEELERIDRMRKEFIANISHDLRSPLTSIKGFAQAMMDGTIPPENQEKYLKIVLANTEHLTNLTHNILLLTQMENNVIQLEMGQFDIHHLLNKVLIHFEKPLQDKALELELLFTDEPVYVKGDLNQIQRVIYNLLDNAIKFCSNGDHIILETHTKDAQVYISISDTGPGMSDSEVKYIWIRFHKGDKSRGKEKGFGIGLSIVREILHAHGQSIDVYSQLGKGTTFTFTLEHILPK